MVCSDDILIVDDTKSVVLLSSIHSKSVDSIWIVPDLQLYANLLLDDFFPLPTFSADFRRLLLLTTRLHRHLAIQTIVKSVIMASRKQMPVKNKKALFISARSILEKVHN